MVNPVEVLSPYSPPSGSAVRDREKSLIANKYKYSVNPPATVETQPDDENLKEKRGSKDTTNSKKDKERRDSKDTNASKNQRKDSKNKNGSKDRRKDSKDTTTNSKARRKDSRRDSKDTTNSKTRRRDSPKDDENEKKTDECNCCCQVGRIITIVNPSKELQERVMRGEFSMDYEDNRFRRNSRDRLDDRRYSYDRFNDRRYSRDSFDDRRYSRDRFGERRYSRDSYDDYRRNSSLLSLNKLSRDRLLSHGRQYESHARQSDVKRYDSLGHPFEVKRFDARGVPIVEPNKYDSRGRPLFTRLFDSRGRPVETKQVDPREHHYGRQRYGSQSRQPDAKQYDSRDLINRYNPPRERDLDFVKRDNVVRRRGSRDFPIKQRDSREQRKSTGSRDDVNEEFSRRYRDKNPNPVDNRSDSSARRLSHEQALKKLRAELEEAERGAKFYVQRSKEREMQEEMERLEAERKLRESLEVNFHGDLTPLEELHTPPKEEEPAKPASPPSTKKSKEVHFQPQQNSANNDSITSKPQEPSPNPNLDSDDRISVGTRYDENEATVNEQGVEGKPDLDNAPGQSQRTVQDAEIEQDSKTKQDSKFQQQNDTVPLGSETGELKMESRVERLNSVFVVQPSKD